MIENNKVYTDKYIDSKMKDFEFNTLINYGRDVYGNLVLVFENDKGNPVNVTFSSTPMGGINIQPHTPKE